MLLIRNDAFQLEHPCVPISASIKRDINTMEWLNTIATVNMMMYNYTTYNNLICYIYMCVNKYITIDTCDVSYLRA